MQTNLADWIKDTPEGIEADAILRKCCLLYTSDAADE